MAPLSTRVFRTLIATLLISCAPFVASCGFSPTVVPVSCSDFDETNLTPLTSQSTQFGFQDVGTIAAIHGTGTAKVDGKSFVKVQQSVALPGYADKATVFLNGWRANYPDSGYHLINVGTGIGNIKSNIDAEGKNRSLSWVATGSLTDTNSPRSLNMRVTIPSMGEIKRNCSTCNWALAHSKCRTCCSSQTVSSRASAMRSCCLARSTS